MMRLFIAIQFDDRLIDALTGFQDNLKEQGVTGKGKALDDLYGDRECIKSAE